MTDLAMSQTLCQRHGYINAIVIFSKHFTRSWVNK